jgi:hypothetical protein
VVGAAVVSLESVEQAASTRVETASAANILRFIIFS